MPSQRYELGLGHMLNVGTKFAAGKSSSALAQRSQERLRDLGLSPIARFRAVASSRASLRARRALDNEKRSHRVGPTAPRGHLRMKTAIKSAGVGSLAKRCEHDGNLAQTEQHEHLPRSILVA
jgi:hypothetical protein